MKTKNRVWLFPLIVMGLVLILNNSCGEKEEEEPADKIADKDGNVYTSVTIGTQTWMVENLQTTKYNDGTSIPNIINEADWDLLATPAYRWYDNNIANKSIYGPLYNRYTVNTGKLCPTGCHVPNGPEWNVLSTYLGGYSIAGGKMKETGTTHWQSPNTGATNESGFTALPGGMCGDPNSDFWTLGTMGYFWEGGNDNIWFVEQYSAELTPHLTSYRYGFSVRCLKD